MKKRFSTMQRSGVLKRIFTCVIALALAMPMTVQTGWAATTSYTVTVADGYLALRNAKAYDDKNEIGKLYTGDTVDVTDSSGSTYWYVYASRLKKSGYVNRRYLANSSSERYVSVKSGYLALRNELHPKSWTRKSTKGVQKSMGKELFSEELKLAVVQYVLEGHTCKEASEKFCVSCTPIEKWVNLYKLHGAKGLLSRNLVGRQKGFDGEFRLKVLQYKQEHHLSCTQTAMHFCLDVVTVCRWEKKFQKEGARGLMKKQATKGSEKRQKKQEQSELQQENKRLSEENYRLRMENDYLKKLNALIQKREKPE